MDKRAIILLIMQNIAGYIHKSLLKTGKTIATAESCSGGILSGLLTQSSGSSRYFTLGVVSYSNQAKIRILKIPASTIAKKDEVSQEVASLMAKNIRRIARTNLGIGITGIAGPTGARPGKPIGTVFICVANENKTICKKFIFRGNRVSIRKQSALKALQLLKQIL